MSKRKHNFFRLCSLVLAFLLMFSNMPTVAYAAEDYSAEALEAGADNGSENDVITEDDEIIVEEIDETDQEEVADPVEEEPEDDPAESEDAELEEIEAVDAEETEEKAEKEAEEKGSRLFDGNDNVVTVTFYKDGSVINFVNVVKGGKIDGTKVITPDPVYGKVFDGWYDRETPNKNHYTNGQLLDLIINENYVLDAYYADALSDLAFTYAEQEVNYGDQVSNSLNLGEGNYFVEYLSDNEAVAKEENGKIVTAGIGEAVITANVYSTWPAGEDQVLGEMLGTATFDLTVKARPITIRPAASECTTTYDGNAKDVTGVEPTVTSDLLSGHTVTATVEGGNKTNAGEYPLTVTNAEITEGTKDVTELYAITYDNAEKLVINPMEVDLKWESLNLKYTGTELKPVATVEAVPTLEITVAAYSDSAYKVPATPKNVGTYYALASITDTNYEITEPGTDYNIIPADTLYVKATDVTEIFTGSSYSPDVEVYKDAEFKEAATGYTLKYSTKNGEIWTPWTTDVPEFTAVGEYTVKVQATKLNWNSSEVVETKVTITKKQLYVKVITYEGGYDGNAHPAEVEVYADKDFETEITTGLTIKYKKEGDADWSGTVPTLTDIGEVKFAVKVSKQDYEDLIVEDNSIVITAPKLEIVEAEGYVGPYVDGTSRSPEVKTVKDSQGLVIADYTIMYSDDEGISYSSEKPSVSAPDTYNYLVKVKKDNYEESDPVEVTIAIDKLEYSLTDAAITGWAYQGYDAETNKVTYTLTPAATVTIQYKKKTDPDTAYAAKTANELKALDAGDYVVKITAPATDIYIEKSVTVNFAVTKADYVAGTDFTAPTAKDDLVFTGGKLDLINAGVPANNNSGAFKYYGKKKTGDIPDVATTIDKSLFKDSLPTGINAGDYWVYYYYTGDANHNEFVRTFLGTVTIAKADIDVSNLSVKIDGWTFGAAVLDGKFTPNEPVLYGTLDDGVTVAFRYYKDSDVVKPAEPTAAELAEKSKPWASTDISNTTKPGDYHVYATITGGSNYNDGVTTPSAFAIAKKPVHIEVNKYGTDGTTTYSGTAIAKTTFTVTIDPENRDAVAGYALPSTTDWAPTLLMTEKNGTTPLDYAVDAGEYTISIASIADADTKSDYYTTADKIGNVEYWKPTTLTINKATIPSITDCYTGSFNDRADWEYDGVEYELFSSYGSPVAGYKVYYAKKYYETLPTTAPSYTDIADNEWSETKPKGKEAGVYYIFYKFRRGDGKNYEDAYSNALQVKVTKKASAITTAPTLKGKDEMWYDGTPQKLIAGYGAATGGTIRFSTDYVYKEGGFASQKLLEQDMASAHWYSAAEAALDPSLLTGTEVGQYNAYYYVEADTNYNDLYDITGTGDNKKYNVFKVAEVEDHETQINPAVITITANDTWVVYGENPDPSFTSTVTPLNDKMHYDTDDEKLLGIKYNPATGTEVGSYKLGLESVNAKLNEVVYYVAKDTPVMVGTKYVVGNYLIYDFIPGTLYIEPAPVTVYIEDKEKVYNGTGKDPEFSYLVEGMAYGESGSLIAVPDIFRANVDVQDVKVDENDTEVPYTDVLRAGDYTFSIENAQAYETNYGVSFSRDDGTLRFATPDIKETKGFKKAYGTEVQRNYIVTYVAGDFTILYDKINFTEPYGLEDLAYDHTKDQDLIDYGAADKGTIYYQVVDHDATAPKISDEGWKTIADQADLKRKYDGTYDVYYYVKSDVLTGIKSIPAKNIDDPLGPIVVTIDKTYADVIEDPQAAENLAYDESMHKLLASAGAVENGTIYYTVLERAEDADVPVDLSGIKPEDYNGLWLPDIPERMLEGLYDVYYYVEGSEVGNEDHLRYVSTGILGPVSVPIADTYAEVTVDPVAAQGLEYNNSDQKLLESKGTADHGTLYYAVLTRNAGAENPVDLSNVDPLDPDIEENYGIKWSTEIPEKKSVGLYDVYYYVNGSEFEGRTGLYYVTTPILGPISVPISDRYAKITEKPVIMEQMYDGTDLPLIDPANKGKAENGTLKYRVEDFDPLDPQKEITDPDMFNDWTTTVPTGKNAGDYVVWYYADGTQDQELEYKDSPVYGPIKVTIDKRIRTLDVPAGEKPFGPESISVSIGRTHNLYAQINENMIHDGDTVYYTDPGFGCTINKDGVLKAGDKVAETAVTVTISGNPNYEADSREIAIKITGENGGDTGENGKLRVEWFGLEDTHVIDGVGKIPAYTYTGYAIKPDFEVYNGEKLLVKDIDYTVSYVNNVKASTETNYATIKIKGKGNYKATQQVYFYINKADINDVIIGNTVVEFNKAMSPVFTYMGKKLVLGKDYTDVPTGKQQKTGEVLVDGVKGIGNFTGTLEPFFVTVVTQQQLRSFVVSLPKNVNQLYYYNGEEIRLEDQLVVLDKATKLPLTAEDYMVSYSNNVNAGTVTVMVIGQGLYKGTVKKSFKINPAKYATIILANENTLMNYGVDYSNLGAKPELELMADLDGDGNGDEALVPGKDYKVTYSDNTKAYPNYGKFKVTFIGNYKGHEARYGQFKINPAEFSTGTITVKGQFVYDSKKPKYSNYLAKPGTNLFLTVGGVVLKTTEYTVKFLDENGKEIVPKNNVVFPNGEDPATITVIAVPKTANYGKSSTALFTYTIEQPSAAGDISDISKAKFKVVDKATGKAAKASYTGSAIEFDNILPNEANYAESVKNNANTRLRLVMTVNGEVFTSDGYNYVGGSQVEVKCISDYFNMAYVNNVRRGTARVIISPYGDAMQGERYVGSAIAKFSIIQSSVKDTLRGILEALLT